MKYLLIGIDGAQKELFYRFSMPFMQKMLECGVSPVLHEDLISRGWVEICTGSHATESGGYYERPLMNGTHEWTSAYNLLDQVKTNPNITTLWDMLNKNELSVGIMNVPTTNPAPNVEGFFVSGGGGGREVSDSVDIEQCYPPGIKHKLDEIGYIVDERVPSLLFEKKLYKEHDFFAQLKLMNEKRVESYLLLNKEYDVDFGFIVFRSMVVVEFLAASEIDRYLSGKTNINTSLIASIKDFYEHLDSCFERLCSELSAEKIAFVSDHGMMPLKYSINLNAFLKENDFQEKQDVSVSFLSYIKKYKNLIPYPVRLWLKSKKSIAKSYSAITDFDKKKTLAFNISEGSSFLGIYVNDKERFGGPVNTNDIDFIANKVVSIFNADNDAKKHNLHAELQTEKYVGEYSMYWPDILIEVPDGYRPDNQSKSFITPVERSNLPINLKEVCSDIWTGTKSTTPLSVFIGHQNVESISNEKGDLATVFDVVIQELGL